MNHRKAFSNLHLVAILLGTLGLSATANAGAIFVSGDTNITNALSGTFTAVNAGNQQFFTNVLAGGTSVLVLENSTDLGSPSTIVADTEVHDFYNSLMGVTSTLHSGAVTASSLSGVDLFFSAIPDDAFSGDEIDALADFVAAGGTIFFTGENIASVFGTANDAINEVLLALSSTMLLIEPDSIDGGSYFQTTPQPDPFTAGVGTFTYSLTSRVIGGTVLFRALDEDQRFVAYEATEDPVPTPEPSTLLLLGVGLVAIYRRRR